MDVGIKAALGYDPLSTTDWRGDRPSTRMGAIAMLRENIIKAKKCKGLSKKVRKWDEVEPLTEVFIDILSGKYKMMVHVHKEDDVIVLIHLAREFGIKVVVNHCVDVYRTGLFTALKDASISIVYRPMDSFTYKRVKTWEL